MKNAAKKICLICLATMFLFGIVFTLSSCESKGKKIDHEIWDVTVLKDRNGEKYARIWGLNEKGIKQSKENTEAIIPETIGGYPVKVLDNYRSTWPPVGGEEKAAKLGELTKIKIEANVTIDHYFFEESKVYMLEFTSKSPSTLKNMASNINGSIICIVPEDSDDDYLVGYVGFKPSEMINGYLIKNQIFYGYIGTESYIEIPEGITELTQSISYIRYSVSSAKIPSTVQTIYRINPFRNWSGTGSKKIFLSKETIIEKGAIPSNVEIEYYEN
ncbi:MAG: hypothetical protein LBT20_03135 [Clostridiales bacterium]|jgi:hypothetical protein|nr:hypothetical protein [Clostridiales bacterium]